MGCTSIAGIIVVDGGATIDGDYTFQKRLDVSVRLLDADDPPAVIL